MAFIDKILKKDKTSHREFSNPWAGLSSYEDPDKTDHSLRFYGRSEETRELYNLIVNALLVTLYGKSGIGKTSLLNAGVFPLLRENNYYPIYLRLGVNVSVEDISKSIVSVVESSIKSSFGSDSIKEIDVVPKIDNSYATEYLWAYFARHKFHNDKDEIIFPVLVFDQFEEFIRSNREATVSLLKQLAFLTDSNNALRDCMIDGYEYSYDYNFRFVLSIREDDLYSLEDILNIHYLFTLKTNRYRLHNLSDSGAKEIVVANGRQYFDSEYIDEISETIVAASKSKIDGLVSTNVLSLICTRLYDVVRRKGHSAITLNDVKEYLLNDPFEEYYSSAVRTLSESEKNFIENNLVTSDGRRNVIPKESLRAAIKSSKPLFEGDTRILQSVASEGKSDDNVELLHDGICAVVRQHRNIRLEKQRVRSLFISLSLYFVMVAFLLTGIIKEIADYLGIYNISFLNHLQTIKYDLMNNDPIGVAHTLSLKEVIYVHSYAILLLLAAGIGWRIASTVLLIWILLYFIPKLICRFYYNTLSVFHVIFTFIWLALSYLLYSSWFWYSDISNKVSYCNISWLLIIVLYVIYRKKIRRNERL